MDIPRDNQEWINWIEALKKKLPESFAAHHAPVPALVNRNIDHTLLSESATEEQVDILCDEAKEREFASVCVRLRHVAHAAQLLKDFSGVDVACVIAFPGGMDETSAKVKETKEALAFGASELDMVMKYPLLKEQKYVEVFQDIMAVREAAPKPVTLKVILETSQLNRDQIIAGAMIASMAGADYVKTSTGFNGRGATVENVELMRAVADLTGKGSRVKASGGIRTADDCVKMLKAGAERIGTSSGVKIMEQLDHGELLEQGKRKTFSHQPNPPGQNDNQDDLFTSKPSAVFTPSGGRSHTLSVAIPGSIIANAHSIEQKTLLAGAIARALAVFCVDEVVVFDDDETHTSNYHDDDTDYESPITKPNHLLSGTAPPSKGYTAYSDPSHFLAHLLSYLETPPYLRKHLFPMHPNLRTAGLLPSLDMPHHLRANEWCDYREGIVVSTNIEQGNGTQGTGTKMSKSHHHNNANHTNHNRSPGGRRGSIVDTGLSQKVVLPDISLPEHARVTVRFSPGGPDQAEPVHPSTPRAEAGYYWGYYVRRCRSLSDVFTECPFDGGYDLSFGTSERGAPVSDVLDEDPRSLPEYKHLLVVFGGVAGIEAAIRNDHQLREMIHPTDAGKLFDYWVNLLPGQGSRTIRTEEAVWLGLTSLRGLVESNNRKF
ncbi:methyltransferase activity [Aspergillus sclerotialis]|uniref:deoxyribose-phosphate aldolase n=1 Tax=Aspergillus sclerotialis TaxID=2070753 RepID=A0A3A3A656_9EURO|nr:methyltransferase activity [Aspergillus sclerotialis]